MLGLEAFAPHIRSHADTERRLLEREPALLSQQRKVVPESFEVEVDPFDVEIEQSILALAVCRLGEGEVGEIRSGQLVWVVGGKAEWLFRVEGGVSGFGRGEPARNGLDSSDQKQT